MLPRPQHSCRRRPKHMPRRHPLHRPWFGHLRDPWSAEPTDERGCRHTERAPSALATCWTVRHHRLSLGGRAARHKLGRRVTVGIRPVAIMSWRLSAMMLLRSKCAKGGQRKLCTYEIMLLVKHGSDLAKDAQNWPNVGRRWRPMCEHHSKTMLRGVFVE